MDKKKGTRMENDIDNCIVIVYKGQHFPKLEFPFWLFSKDYNIHGTLLRNTGSMVWGLGVRG